MIAETRISFCANIRIGHDRDNPEKFVEIIRVQTNYCKSNDSAVMVSTMLAGFGADMMKDNYHYLQAAYNTVRTDAGKNTAFYINTGIEPYMYDPEYNTVYMPYDGILIGEPENGGETGDGSIVFTFDKANENFSGYGIYAVTLDAANARTVTESTVEIIAAQ